MKTHDLKSWPPFFGPVLAGEKNFELRRDDRGFEVGDVVVLHEYRPMLGEYTGRTAQKTIRYVARGAEVAKFGLQDGYCIIGF